MTNPQIDGPLYAGAGAQYSAMYFESQPTEAEVAWQTEQSKRSIDGDDLLEELHDVRDLLAILAKQGRADVVGKIVVAVVDAYAARLAHIHLDIKDAPVFAAEAAAVVIAREITNG